MNIEEEIMAKALKMLKVEFAEAKKAIRAAGERTKFPVTAEIYVAEDGTYGAVKDLQIMKVNNSYENDDDDVNGWAVLLELELLQPATGVTTSYDVYTWLDKSDHVWKLRQSDQWLPDSPLGIDFGYELELMSSIAKDSQTEPLYFDNASFGDATGIIYLDLISVTDGTEYEVEGSELPSTHLLTIFIADEQSENVSYFAVFLDHEEGNEIRWNRSGQDGYESCETPLGALDNEEEFLRDLL